MQSASVVPPRHVLQAIANAWNNWWERRAQLAAFDACNRVEMQRIAKDLGVSFDELRTLAGRDKTAADLLFRRMAALGLDPASVDPAVMRDLERCCSECDSKKRCVHDLETQPQEPDWAEYCPNSETLSALKTTKNH
jgi:hypothetical protein